MNVSVIVPTFNEADNCEEMITRLDRVLPAQSEIVFADDGTDDLPARAIACRTTQTRVRVVRRENGEGGLGGAVIDGIRHSSGAIIVVMDGDLQHPPETVPAMIEAARRGDVAVASRYVPGGDPGGLENGYRKVVSKVSGGLARGLFPERLKNCSDPMSGFFAINRDKLNLEILKPRGFKILLEILARHRLRVVEVPLKFAERIAGESHASVKEGLRFFRQLFALRFNSKVLRYALVGASGIIPNLAMVYFLTGPLGTVLAAIIGTQVALAWNFIGAEGFVWKDHRHGLTRHRALKFLAVGELDLLRIPLVLPLVHLGLGNVMASLLTMVVFYFLRFALNHRVVYRAPAKSAALLIPTQSSEIIVFVQPEDVMA